MPQSVSTCLAELMAHFSFLTGLVAHSGLLAHLGFSSVGRGYFYAALSFDLSVELVVHLVLEAVIESNI